MRFILKLFSTILAFSGHVHIYKLHIRILIFNKEQFKPTTDFLRLLYQILAFKSYAFQF